MSFSYFSNEVTGFGKQIYSSTEKFVDVFGFLLLISGFAYSFFLICEYFQIIEKIKNLIENSKFEKFCVFVSGIFIKQTGRFFENLLGKHYAETAGKSFTFLKECTGIQEISNLQSDSPTTKFALISSKCVYILGILSIFFLFLILIKFFFLILGGELGNESVGTVFIDSFEIYLCKMHILT